MNVNIAFNTIIYIIVFIFPGILFRRAYFVGKFNKNFEQNNAFEKLLWNLLTSIIMLAVFCIFIYTINTYTPAKIDFKLKTSNILETFKSTYDNKLPIVLSNEESIVDVSKVLLSLYGFSILLGFFCKKIVFYTGLENKNGIIKTKNFYEYITTSNKVNNSRHSFGDLYYTKVDVKTTKDDLFIGRLHDISYDKDGKIEAISLQDTYKYYKLNYDQDIVRINEVKRRNDESDPYIIIHSETPATFVYRKRIKGDLFTIMNGEIQNVSISYIKILNFYQKFQKILYTVFSILILFAFVFSLLYALWDFHLIPFTSTTKRIIFCIVTPVNFLFFILLLLNIFNLKKYKSNKNAYKKTVKETVVSIIFFLIPYLGVFNYLSPIMTLILLFIFLFLIGIMNKTKSQQNDSKLS